MKILTVIVILLFKAYSCYCSNLPEPVVVLTQYGNWSSYNGPEIVIYSDSTVIYRKKKYNYYITQLSSNEYKELIDSLDLNYLQSIKQKKLNYYIEDATWTTMIFWNEGVEIRIPMLGSVEFLTSELSNSLDEKLKSAVIRLTEFKKKNSSKWIPNKIEVKLWIPKNSKDKRVKYINWPIEWPDTTDHSSIRRNNWDEPFYSIYLPKEYWTKYKRLKNKIYRKQNSYKIIMNGLNWRLSGYRFPFPNEQKWVEK